MPMTIERTKFELAQLLTDLLGEMRYVLNTNDVEDSRKNSVDLRDQCAKALGYANYEDFDEDCEGK